MRKMYLPLSESFDPDSIHTIDEESKKNGAEIFQKFAPLPIDFGVIGIGMNTDPLNLNAVDLGSVVDTAGRQTLDYKFPTVSIYFEVSPTEAFAGIEYSIHVPGIGEVSDDYIEKHYGYQPVFEAIAFALKGAGADGMFRSGSDGPYVQVLSEENLSELAAKIHDQEAGPVIYASFSDASSIVFDDKTAEILSMICNIYISNDQKLEEKLHQVWPEAPCGGDVFIKGTADDFAVLKSEQIFNEGILNLEEIYRVLHQCCFHEFYRMSILELMTVLMARDAVHERDMACQLMASMTEQLEVYKERHEVTKELCEKLEEVNDLLTEHKEMLEQENEMLKWENEKLKQELSHYKDVVKGEELVIFQGPESELYPGETLEIILSILASSLNGLAQGSRRKDVLQSVLQANYNEGTLSDKKDILKMMFKVYKDISPEFEEYLNTLGIELSEDKKSYILTYYGDPRYVVKLSKTGSDFRSGSATASKISRNFF